MPTSVFISSTSQDLCNHRSAVAEALRRAGFQAIDMADFGARPEGATTASLEEVAQADLFVGIYAWRYGFIPEGAEISITEQEFVEAERLKKPRFCFIVDEQYGDWPEEDVEKGIGARLLREFKARLDAKLVRDVFTTPGDLATKVLASLQRWTVKPKVSRLPFEPDTVEIPAGLFWMGREPGEGATEWESPRHQIELPAYQIGKFPVTNKQYEEFVRDTQPEAIPPTWQNQKPARNKLNHPVKGVTWYDALAYCQWLTKQTKGERKYTLPSEAQWEKAARGVDGWLYPWGNAWDANRCNHGRDQTTPVDKYPAQSKWGVFDMIGNVREWTSTIWGVVRPRPDLKYCYPWDKDGRDNPEAGCFLYRVYRGGGAADDEKFLTCSARAAYSPLYPGPPGNWHGFRVVIND